MQSETILNILPFYFRFDYSECTQTYFCSDYIVFVGIPLQTVRLGADYPLMTCIITRLVHITQPEAEWGEVQASRKKMEQETWHNLKQLSTKLLGSHSWVSLPLRRRCNWPKVNKRFEFFHTTKQMHITPSQCSSRARPMGGAVSENKSVSRSILGALTEGLRKPDPSWELLLQLGGNYTSGATTIH